MYATPEKRASWLDRPLLTTITLNWELILFITILIFGFFSRFYDLGARVMSHDENSHVYYSWLFSRGQGYTHDPITHGPFQFHVVALSYFLFGDSDFTARIPAALFSVAAIAFLWNYRRYLGRAGTIAAAVMMLISPYMVFYGRYVRNEAFVALFGLITLWAILRYLETGLSRYLLYLTAATAFHFTTKETAFIYTAQALIFLAFYLLYRLTRDSWLDPSARNRFLVAVLVGFLLFAGAFGVTLLHPGASTPQSATLAAPGPGVENTAAAANILPLAIAGLGLVALLVGGFFLIRGYGWQNLRRQRAFGMLIVLGTLVMPMLAPFPVKALGFNPIEYTNSQSIAVSAAFAILLAVLAAGIGLLWDWRLWLLNFGLFYAIFTVFYTSLFTNGFGFVTGLVGSLGYWLEQQGVNRGSQPLYYYALIQVPIYEFLPALASLLALVIALFRKREKSEALESEAETVVTEASATEAVVVDEAGEEDHSLLIKPPVLSLLGFWSVTSLLAYSVAGEKMPWLTVHITLPMILLGGWAIGYLIDTINWTFFRERRGWLILLLLPVFLLSLSTVFSSLLGINPPFQGQSLEQLRVTVTFVTSLVFAAASGAALLYLSQPWPGGQFTRVATLFVFGVLAILTARAAYRAAFINYDDATEYLVYAHSAPGVKEALSQIEEISRRTTGGLDLTVAYDDVTSYPYWWYLRHFPNQRSFGANPTRSIREAQAILVGEENYGKVDSIVGQSYYKYDYIRLWWPSQDYFGLTWERIKNAITNPEMRTAIFDIWLNRDYTLFGQLTKKDFSLPNWSPASRMRLYIRKDVAAEMWDYGVVPSAEEQVVDPYAGKQVTINADRVIGVAGSGPGQFNRPRGVAIAADGSLYVADTDNNRIQHIAPDGSVLHTWGSKGDIAQGNAPGGTFNEPWGIAVGPDGSVYVADVWNHRIQKFTADGQFLTMWGYFGQAERPEAFWGPRDVYVDANGRVFVTDTGNDRVVVFDADGNYLAQFGQEGAGPGDFDEPVSIDQGPDGRFYITDTWNQRIQVFEEADGSFIPYSRWDVAAWYGDSKENKPYISVDEQGNVFATDPEGYRVLEFNSQGKILRYWGDYSTGELDGFGLAGAVAADSQGGVWVTDTGNGRLLHFSLSGLASQPSTQP